MYASVILAPQKLGSLPLQGVMNAMQSFWVYLLVYLSLVLLCAIHLLC